MSEEDMAQAAPQQPQQSTGTNVRQMREPPAPMPTEESASHGAVSAIVDSIVAATGRETQKAREVLDAIDEAAAMHGARLKTELGTFLDTIQAVNEDGAARTKHLESLRALHARLVNARVAD